MERLRLSYSSREKIKKALKVVAAIGLGYLTFSDSKIDLLGDASKSYTPSEQAARVQKFHTDSYGNLSDREKFMSLYATDPARSWIYTEKLHKNKLGSGLLGFLTIGDSYSVKIRGSNCLEPTAYNPIAAADSVFTPATVTPFGEGEGIVVSPSGNPQNAIRFAPNKAGLLVPADVFTAKTLEKNGCAVLEDFDTTVVLS